MPLLKLFALFAILFTGNTFAVSNETRTKEPSTMSIQTNGDHVLPLKPSAIGYICSNAKTTPTSNDSAMLLIGEDFMKAIHNLTKAISALNNQVQIPQNKTNITSPINSSKGSSTFSQVMALVDNFISSISGIVDLFFKAFQTMLSWRQLVHLRHMAVRHLPLIPALIHVHGNAGAGRQMRAGIANI